MKRFTPFTTYKINDEIRYSSTAPDGVKKDSANWLEDRIEEIRQIFLPKNKYNKLGFKEYQEEIISSILSGKDTFAVLPTGSGKSLCFQAPAVFFPGITLVVTPLAALIKNQVRNFNNNHYPIHHKDGNRNFYDNFCFKAIYPGMNGLSGQAMFSEIQNPRENGVGNRHVQYKLLYVSPERLHSPKFLRALKDAEDKGFRIHHVVIDEAHCMSQWGFEFRESYLYIPDFIGQRPIRPIISLFTATATPKDREEIKNIFHFPSDVTEYAKKKYTEIPFDNRQNPVRPMDRRGNLRLHVIRCSDYDPGTGEKAGGKSGAETGSPAPLLSRQDALIQILEENITKVCIIYRTTVSGVDELYDTLKKNELLRDRIARYHARMPEASKNKSENAFLNSSLSRHTSKSSKNIMIATKAFGMGIDKRDISLIIHYDVPRSLEDYYQEVGRAGRDAVRVPEAHCYLLYAAGPRSKKGTLQYTIGWVTSGKNAPGSGCMPISSQFSEEMKENIYFWSYYRLCCVMKYCNIIGGNGGLPLTHREKAQSAGEKPEESISDKAISDKAHTFISEYLENGFTENRIRQIGRDLNFFYDYITEYYPVPEGERERFAKEYLFQAADAEKFLGSCSPEAKQRTEQCHAEIKRLIKEVNELHINNTQAANILRSHPDRYRLNEPYLLSEDAPDSGQEWKSRQNKKVKGEVSLSLRKSDITEDSAFLFVSNPDTCEEYVNTAWNARRHRESDAALIFTVNYRHKINGVLKRCNESWKTLTGEESLLPYSRYLGCHVKGLFPQKQYSLWRKTKRDSKNPQCPEAVSPANADSLFAYVSGAGKREMNFTLYGEEKLSYFDMCVLDAVYSIESAQKETLYVQTIWEVLTGRNPEYFPHNNFRTAIRNSIDKMRALSISLSDSRCGFEIKEAVFLPLKDKPGGQKGYSYSAIPPLFRYAEEMNGEIIRVPVSLLNMKKLRNSAVWKEDFHAEFSCRLWDPALFGRNKNGKAPGKPVKCVPLNAEYESAVRKLISSKEYAALESIRKHPCFFTPSIENALLCHYLIHRIAISKNRKRGNYILFSKIRSVTGISEDSCLFQKKTAAIMNHYKNIGFFRQYYLYITDYPYQMEDGTSLTDTACFQAESAPTVKFWHAPDACHLLLSDFDLNWSWQYNLNLKDPNSNFQAKCVLADAICRRNRRLSADAEKKLAAISLGRMDGMVLQHK